MSISRKVVPRSNCLCQMWSLPHRSPFAVSGASYIANSLRRILAPQVGQMLVIRLLDGQPNHTSIYGAACSFGEHQPDFLAVDIKYHVSSHLIKLTLSEERQGSAVPLHLLFRLMPSQPYAPIHEVVEGRNQRHEQVPKNSTDDCGSVMRRTFQS